MRTVVLLSLLMACSAADDGPPEGSPPGPAPYILVVGFDGVRADAIAHAHTPALDRIATLGAWSDGSGTWDLDGVSHVDTHPTVIDALGLPLLDTDGSSRLPTDGSAASR